MAGLARKFVDCYKVLGLPPTCTDGEIKKKFAELAKQLHPDSGSASQCRDKFQAVTEAYRQLTANRREYDALYEANVGSRDGFSTFSSFLGKKRSPDASSFSAGGGFAKSEPFAHDAAFWEALYGQRNFRHAQGAFWATGRQPPGGPKFWRSLDDDEEDFSHFEPEWKRRGGAFRSHPRREAEASFSAAEGRERGRRKVDGDDAARDFERRGVQGSRRAGRGGGEGAASRRSREASETRGGGGSPRHARGGASSSVFEEECFATESRNRFDPEEEWFEDTKYRARNHAQDGRLKDGGDAYANRSAARRKPKEGGALGRWRQWREVDVCVVEEDDDVEPRARTKSRKPREEETAGRRQGTARATRDTRKDGDAGDVGRAKTARGGGRRRGEDQTDEENRDEPEDGEGEKQGSACARRHSDPPSAGNEERSSWAETKKFSEHAEAGASSAPKDKQAREGADGRVEEARRAEGRVGADGESDISCSRMVSSFGLSADAAEASEGPSSRTPRPSSEALDDPECADAGVGSPRRGAVSRTLDEETAETFEGDSCVFQTGPGAGKPRRRSGGEEAQSQAERSEAEASCGEADAETRGARGQGKPEGKAERPAGKKETEGAAEGRRMEAQHFDVYSGGRAARGARNFFDSDSEGDDAAAYTFFSRRYGEPESDFCRGCGRGSPSSSSEWDEDEDFGGRGAGRAAFWGARCGGADSEDEQDDEDFQLSAGGDRERTRSWASRGGRGASPCGGNAERGGKNQDRRGAEQRARGLKEVDVYTLASALRKKGQHQALPRMTYSNKEGHDNRIEGVLFLNEAPIRDWLKTYGDRGRVYGVYRDGAFLYSLEWKKKKHWGKVGAHATYTASHC
ncbi:DnaJ domain-containing protein [Besnoitia besnoiti]|uniref:DnaJ domain-containing protein n=1 Tax=Besnoitia besnoiti TaxID=94643 RepID=A0A2A9M9G8_BESBE|nr:DnaJ domain-containing protein [Besnoitia besnoiti]PFH32022.1 DnaJ domain-containing protein [Besnoitia besnoiti]